MTETLSETPRIDGQFNGPNRSGNGGYVCGLVGSRFRDATAVRVDLRTPPPLDRELRWDAHDRHLDLVDGETVVASGQASELVAEDPLLATVGLDAATAARSAYEGFDGHPFARCFTCGTDRDPGDGLQVYSGPLPDGRMGCPWVPHEAFADAEGLLAPAYAWAALDCPGGWAAHIKENPMVLGRMTAAVYRRPRIGELCIVIGALRGVERRKNHASTALYSADGELLGRAEQIWITIDIADFA